MKVCARLSPPKIVMLAMRLTVCVLGLLIDSRSQGTVPGPIIFFEKDQRSAKSQRPTLRGLDRQSAMSRLGRNEVTGPSP
jgi:hypothetical protein